MNDRLKEVSSSQMELNTAAVTGWWPRFFVSLQAENRAEFAERTVAKLEKTIDDLEGTVVTPFTRVLPSTSLCSPDFSVSVFSFPSWSAQLCIFPTFLLSLSLLTDVQTNCTIRSWNTRLSARSWIMPSMIWTPCNAALRIFALAAALLIWRLLFLLFSLIYPKCTIKLFFSCTLSPFFFLSLYCLLEFLCFFTI